MAEKRKDSKGRVLRKGGHERKDGIPLSGRQTANRKPWTRFYGITARESALPPLKTDTSTQTPRTA